MKKIYLLCLFFCITYAAVAQTTVTIWATGTAPGTYKTGSALEVLPAATYTRVDGTIAVTNSSSARQAGYAVFDLSSIPTGATISSVTLGLNIYGATLASYGTCVTYGHLGDLSTITIPSTLYADCASATWNPYPGNTIATATIGTAAGSYYNGTTTGVGELDMTSGPPSSLASLITFVNNVLTAPGKVGSISFSSSASPASGLANVYNFTGYNYSPTNPSPYGSLAILGPHAPFLTITYCAQPVIYSASITPNPICAENTATLVGTDSFATFYSWAGPSGFSTSVFSNSVSYPAGFDAVFTPTTTASSGVYTLTAYAACGTYTLTTTRTTTLTVNPTPATITSNTTTVCAGNTIFLSDITASGVWSSNNASIASVTNGTVVAGANSGTTVISYTLGLCPATATVTVNKPPTAITGPNIVCASGGTITLSDAVTGGTWSSGTSSAATVDPVSGVVTGTTAGPDVISYFTGACSSVTFSITVDPIPTAIIGASVMCSNATLPLSDATTLGAWTTSNTNIATVNSSGVVTGVSAGSLVVTYSLPTSCYVTHSVTVNPIPSAVTGPSAVCVGQVISLSDPTVGGTWSSASTALATVGSVTGVVTGVSGGVVNISYAYTTTGCASTHSVTVNTLPDPIVGLAAVCVAADINLTDDISPGKWSSQLTTVATVDSVTGDVKGVSAGISYISYTLSPTGCFATFSVTVNPLPSSTVTPSGPTTFCVGGSVTLTGPTGTGYTYQWITGGSVISTAISYVANTTETLDLVVKDGNGCLDTSVTQVTLIPNVTIAAGGPTVFCQTGNVLLSVPLAPGIIYQWMLNGVNITGANANTYAAIYNGVYTCSLVVPAGGCSVVTPGFTVVVYPLPVPPVYYNGTQLTTTNGYLTYQWFMNSVAIPGATTLTVTPTVNASYRVRVTDGNSCTGYSSGFIIDNLSVTSVNKTDINIYPNPASSVVNIVSSVNVRAVITDMAGKTIMERENATELNISNLSDGVYMILLFDSSGNRLMVQKLIKE